MAIKGPRQSDAYEVSWFVNEVAERGGILVVNTAGSGTALDSALNVATYSPSSSGKRPIGLLLNDVVNYDLSKQPVNWHKDQANSGDKSAILTKGWIVTNKIVGTPNAEDFAILTSSGFVTNLAPGGTWNEAANPKIGRFRSTLSQDGYAKVYVDL